MPKTHYRATFKDGTTISRKSDRDYTHALKSGSFCGSYALAVKAAAGLVEIAPVEIVPPKAKRVAARDDFDADESERRGLAAMGDRNCMDESEPYDPAVHDEQYGA